MEFVIRRDPLDRLVWEAWVDGAVVAISTPFDSVVAVRRAIAALKVEAPAGAVYDHSAVSADPARASGGSARPA